jgi:hypothetical protein
VQEQDEHSSVSNVTRTKQNTQRSPWHARVLVRRASLSLLLLAVATSCLGAADPIEAELARLEKAAGAIDPAKLHEQLRDMVKFTNDRVSAAKETTDPLLRLYRLRDAHILTESLTYFAAHPEEAKTVDQFVALWTREKPRFAVPAPRANRSHVHNALIEAARNRAEKLRAASLPYSKASEPFSGVYYLGEASANLSFAKFVESLPSSNDQTKPRRPTLAQLTAAADALERETLTFFAADQTTRVVIPTSAKLKETRELIAAGAIDGATLTLRETRLELARRQNKAPATAVVNPLDGLAEFAQSIAATPVKAAAAARAPVTVTLIRWPYT